MLLEAIVNRKRAMSLMSRKLTLSGQLCEQLIHDMDDSITQNERCLKCTAIEIRILYFSSKQIELYYFSAQN